MRASILFKSCAIFQAGGKIMRQNSKLSKIPVPYRLALVGFSCLILACSKQQESTELRWSKGQKTAPPQISVQDQFTTKEQSLMIGSEVLERRIQKWGPAEVEGSYLQSIKSQLGEPQAIISSYIERDSTQLQTIEKMHLERFLALDRIRPLDYFLKTGNDFSEPKVIVRFQGSTPQLLYQVDYYAAAESTYYRVTFSPDKGVIDRRQLGMSFEQFSGVVFPEGPLLSPLTQVPLKNLLGDGFLNARHLKVKTEAAEMAQSSDIFKYEPNDVRFDQVQTFYFVDEALNFFRSKLGVTLPFPLEVVTHVGAPEKRNVFNYFPGGRILLGSGDGVNWQNIMKDPSVVMHETSHSLVDAVARLPNQGQGGSLNEGFADFFTASFLNNPRMGEVSFVKGPFKRNVENTLTYSDQKGVLYGDSLIVSGTLWEVQSKLGSEVAQKFAVRTLSRLGPGGNFDNFGSAVMAALESEFSPEQVAAISNIVASRKWPLK
jgi:hypothetical protein